MVRAERAGGDFALESVPIDTGRAGRDDEFVAFVEEASTPLLRTAWMLTGDVHRAEELVQHALVRTYVAWPRARQEPLAYSRRVLVNLRTDHWRRTRREVLVPAEDLTGVPAEVAPSQDLSAELVSALLRLPSRRRAVVVLRHVLGLSEAEVAEDLRISTGAVKSAASRGIAQLRRDLRAFDGGSGVHDE